MAIFEPLRRGAEELIETLGDGWQWLRDRGASALTRFRDDDVPDGPLASRADSWGLLASEVAETDDEIVVRVEAPGLDEKDISVTVVSGQLVVRGRKRFEREDRGARYHLFESAYGAFERRLALPCAVDADRARAHYRSGVLTIRLPRAARDGRRRIEIRAA